MNSMAELAPSAKGQAAHQPPRPYDRMVLSSGDAPVGVAQADACTTPLPGAAGRRVVHFELPASPASVRFARRMTTSWLALWGLEGADAELVVSELATNAVRHVGLPLAIWLAESAEGVKVEVLDQSEKPANLVAKDLTLDEEGGRGLALVEALSQKWGERRTAAGNCVWAILARIPVNLPVEVAA
jgi:anti-sigma regulatory factor (Ser/Thr protein kinase)